MSQILVSPEQLRDHSRNVAAQAQQAESSFQSLQSRLNELQSAFQGKAATTFQERFSEWHTSATHLVQALQALGQFLNNAAETVEQTDAQLASGLG